MRVMVIGRATQDTEAGVMPTEAEFAAMEKFNDELVNAGVLVGGEGLHPTSRGKRVRFTGRNATVIDGPFTESKELIAGFSLWQVKSMEEAVEWVKRSHLQDTEVEIRPLFEAADFGAEFTPELREQDERLREQIAEQHSAD